MGRTAKLPFADDPIADITLAASATVAHSLLMLRSLLPLSLLLAGCKAPLTHQQCAELMTDEAIIERCGNGSISGVWKEAEDCYPLVKAARLKGVVVIDFERSELFLGASGFTQKMRRYTEGTWLDWSDEMVGRQTPGPIEPGVYLIEFEGRRSACAKPAGKLNGYGHMRQYRDFAVVDRLISWKQVARLPDPFRANGSGS